MASRTFVALSCLAWIFSASTAQDPCVCLEQFGTEHLHNPIFFVTAPGDEDRVFVGEQTGFVWIYDREGNRNDEPFLDISDRFNLAGYDERGLLGMAFHPDIQSNNKFYIYASDLTGGPGNQLTRLSEFQIQEEDPDTADTESERVIMEIDQPAANHNGGEIFFDMFDGLLYVFPGDGGPSIFAQDMTSLLGKVLRIDVDTGDDDIPYNIPEDNPFLDEEGALPEIYALGLRNPWRCTQDRGHPDTGEGIGRIFCGDVGQNYCEEVDIIISGGNYGWNVKECVYCYPLDPPDDPAECRDEPVVTPGEEVLPIFWYTDWAGQQSITGGHVYRGRAMEAFQGDYFWADYRIGGAEPQRGLNRLRQDGDEWNNAVVEICDGSVCGEITEHEDFCFAFGQDQDDELYILESSSLNPNAVGGVIYKVVQP